VDLEIRVASFDVLGAVYGCLDRHGAERLEEEFGEEGQVRLVVRVEAGPAAEALAHAVSDATSGRVPVGRLPVPRPPSPNSDTEPDSDR
jgi:hypothetical protein